MNKLAGYRGETSKAFTRRTREGFFVKYCNGFGLDVGYGGDKVVSNCDGWDRAEGDGDAQTLGLIPDGYYDFVYSSHLLEHLEDPLRALRSWARVLRSGGFLILSVPERDRYERRTRLPSRWNSDHKRFFLIDRDDPPDTVGLLPLLRAVPEVALLVARICEEGWTVPGPNKHSQGEYSIEVIARKV